ncbi:PQQ-like beta-propeller repeat protein [bacterium]|nr:PQQ-like beta-propeller repeat protein [bacterium]
MKRQTISFVIAMTAIAIMCESASADWLRFRGPNGSGISETAAPVEFGADKNMKWKVKLPGKGVSSPIIVGDKVFVTCYSGYGGDLGQDIEELKRHLVCVDRKSGKVIWDKAVKADMPEDPWDGMGVPAHGYASHTPASDGKHVFVFYGKSGVRAYDMDGEEKWHVNVGKESGPRQWGSSSSPIVYKDKVIITASDESEAIVALDAATGKEAWKQEAEMLGGIWGTPALAEGPNGTEIVLAVMGEVWGFNADTGKLRWYSPGNEGANHSVVVADGIAYSLGGGRSGANGVAVKAGQKGEVKELVWENNASGRFASPVVYKKKVFSVSGSIVACYDATNGKKVFEKRLPQGSAAGNAGGDRPQRNGGPGGGGRGGRGGMEYASPIIAGGNMYVVTGGGQVHVIDVSEDYKVLATNDLSFDGSGFSATPAADGGDLMIRSNSHLYCIGE